MHPAPLAAGGDDSCVAQVREMPRDFWLADLKDFHKITDANFLVGDEIEQAQAGTVGQGAKQKVERKWFVLPGHGRNYIWLDKYIQPRLC